MLDHFGGYESVVVVEILVFGFDGTLEESYIEGFPAWTVFGESKTVDRETGFGIVEDFAFDVDTDETGEDDVVGTVDPVSAGEKGRVVGGIIVGDIIGVDGIGFGCGGGESESRKAVEGELVQLEGGLHESGEKDTVGTADIDDRVGSFLP